MTLDVKRREAIIRKVAELKKAAHQRGSTIITSQVPIDHWHEVIVREAVEDCVGDDPMFQLAAATPFP